MTSNVMSVMALRLHILIILSCIMSQNINFLKCFVLARH